jgi:hypothetical protein
MRTLRLLALSLAVALVGVASGGVANASARHHSAVTCHGGTIHAGTYRSLRIAGFCSLPNQGTIHVRHRLTVLGHGILNAATPATLTVGGNVVVRHRGIAAIGCSPDVGCTGVGNDHIGGSLRARGAWMVIVHGTHIGHNVTIRGGGRTQDCTVASPVGAPFYSVVEDSTVGGTLVIRRLHSCWLGVIRNTVGHTVRVIGNRFGDPEATEIVTNTIGGNLACFNNDPAAHVGDSMGLPNVVAGQKRGECASL